MAKNDIFRALLRSLPDKAYLQLQYHYHTGKWINFKAPKDFNEKLQWLKIYDRRPEYTMMVDKVRAKQYVGSIIGQEHIIPTLGVWDDARDIDFDTLPNQFVLKTNHDSKGVLICKDKDSFDKEYARSFLNERLSKNSYWYGREWPYKNVRRKVFAEKYMIDESGSGLIDYKFYCFNGKPMFLYCCLAQFIDGKKGRGLLSFFDFDWNPTPFNRSDHEPFPYQLRKPKNLDEMIRISESLSKDIPFLRVDLYNINDNIYFSELTFTPGSGYGPFSPPEWERKIGDLIVLPSR